MGELILCRQQIAAVPFYIEEISLHVYSLEELCYYMKNNVYLLNPNFMSVELCNWLGRELGMKELERRLLDAMKENAPLHIFVGHILMASGYLTGQEIREILALIASFENKSDEECRKLRGDRLMGQQKIVDAIYEYENLLGGEGAANMSMELLGDVWHNLGTAYARLFFFSEAAACYETAYCKNHKQSALLSMLYALWCGEQKEAFDKAVAKYQAPPDLVDKVREDVARLYAQKSITEFEQQIDGLAMRYHEVSALQKRYREMIDEWKEEYGILCRI